MLWGLWHQDPTPEENQCSRFIAGMGAGGHQWGWLCQAASQGVAITAKSSLGRGWGGEELCWGHSPVGKVLMGKAGASLQNYAAISKAGAVTSAAGLIKNV